MFDKFGSPFIILLNGTLHHINPSSTSPQLRLTNGSKIMAMPLLPDVAPVASVRSLLKKKR